MKINISKLNLGKINLKPNRLYIVLRLDHWQNKKIISCPLKGRDYFFFQGEREKGFTYEIQRVRFDPRIREALPPKLKIRWILGVHNPLFRFGVRDSFFVWKLHLQCFPSFQDNHCTDRILWDMFWSEISGDVWRLSTTIMFIDRGEGDRVRYTEF